MNAKDTVVAERAAGDVGLGVEDEHFRRIAKTGFFSSGRGWIRQDRWRWFRREAMGLRVRPFRQVFALPERVNNAGGDGAGVIAEKLPTRAGVADVRLEADVRGL